MISRLLLLSTLIICCSCIAKKTEYKGLSMSLFGNDMYLGNVNLSHDSYNNLKIVGSLNGDHIKVAGSVKTTGKVVINDSDLKEMSVIGKAKLTNVTMSKDLKVIGKATLNDGNYRDIMLHGQQFSLTNTTAHSITVKSDDSNSKKNQKRQLILTDCTIMGDLICEKGKDYELVLKGKTTISGKITGFNKS